VQTAQRHQQARRGVPVVRRCDRDGEEQAEGVRHDVPLAARHLLPAVVGREAADAVAAARNRLRVGDPRSGLGLAALALTEGPAQPAVELGDQPVLAPAAEEGIDPGPCGEVPQASPATRSRPRPGSGSRPAVAGGSSPRAVRPAPGTRPHRQQQPDGRPLRVCHVRRIPAHPVRMVGRDAVHGPEKSTYSGVASQQADDPAQPSSARVVVPLDQEPCCLDRLTWQLICLVTAPVAGHSLLQMARSTLPVLDRTTDPSGAVGAHTPPSGEYTAA
jgi:hypothetical protein